MELLVPLSVEVIGVFLVIVVAHPLPGGHAD